MLKRKEEVWKTDVINDDGLVCNKKEVSSLETMTANNS